MPLSSCNNIVVPRQNVLVIALSFIFIVTLFAIFSSTNTSKSKSSSSSGQQQQERNNNDADTASTAVGSSGNNDDYRHQQLAARPTPPTSFSSSSSSFDIAVDLPLERIYSDGILVPPFEPISPSPSANPITGDALAEYIRKYLFRRFTKGYFKYYYDEHDKLATTKEKGEFKSQTTEFIGGGGASSSSSSSSSIFVPMASTTNQHWEPLACLDKSTIRCSKMNTVGGPLKEFYPRFNNVSSPLQLGRRRKLIRKKLVSSENYQNDYHDPEAGDDNFHDHPYCCTVATLGRWTRPFDRHLMEDLSREDISFEDLIVKRLIWQPPPISSSSSKSQNSFRLDEAKIRGSEENQKYIRKKRNQLEQEAVEHENMMQRMRKLFSKFGETAEAQQLLEELYVVVGRNMNRLFGSKSKLNNRKTSSTTKNNDVNNNNDEQMKLILLLGLSRLKKVNVDVLEPNDDKQVGDDELLLSKRYQEAEKRYEKKRMMAEVLAENGGGGADNSDDHDENQPDDDNEPSENQKLYTKKRQRAPRIFLTGNSYVRALVSSIAAIFRGQDRYFERGSHRTVRYVVTNVGDYMFYEKSSTSASMSGDDGTFASSEQQQQQQQPASSSLSINESDINSPHFKKVGRRRRKDSGTSNDAKEDHTTAEEKRRTTKPSSSSTGRKTSSTKTTTRNTISQIMRPIRLRRKNEVVLFEIVYQFQTGMQIRSWMMNNNNNKRKEASVPEDFLLESPLLSPEVQQKLFRGSFSAVFMRNFVIHGLGLFHKFFGDGGLKDYCDWQMKTVMKQQQQKQQQQNLEQENCTSHEKDDENFYVALHGSPNIQYLWVDRSQSGIYSKYETQIGKASFERARDEIYLSSTSSSSSSSTIANTSHQSSSFQQRHARHVFIPKPSSANKGEVFTAVDDLGHTQCIVLPHYDEAARGFRHELEQSPEQRQLITALNVQARANNFYYDPSDCSDVLSRNYWMKFGLGAYLSAKSTKKQFSV